MPDILQGLKWHVQFCLRVPPSAAPIVPVGNAAIHIVRMKILFFVSPLRIHHSDRIRNPNCSCFLSQLQITRIPYLPGMDWKDSPSLVLPMVYDVSSNITQIAERRDPVQSIATSAASHQLRRFAEYPSHGECSLFPAVRDLILNLTLPNEQQPNPNQVQFKKKKTNRLNERDFKTNSISDNSVTSWSRRHMSQSHDAFTHARGARSSRCSGRSGCSTRWSTRLRRYGGESGTELDLFFLC